jgi:uncharacterized protein YdaU (DUF1376 family)
MKAYSFYFNASDWLSSQSVKLMSKAERGVYIHLLAIAWGSKQPGTLPASEDQVRRLAECTVAEWAEMGPTILAVFPLSICQSYRYNERLMLEVEKEKVKSEKAAASANKRWQSERNASASDNNANASKNDATPSIAQVQEQVQDTSSLQSEVVAPSAAPPKPSAKKEKAASLNARDYELPTWATEKFAAEFSEWLAYRQGHRSGKLKLPSILRTLNELAGYNEAFCSQLFTHAIKNGNQGLTFQDTASKFAAYQQATPAPKPAKAMPADPRDLWGFNGPPATQEPVVAYSTGQYTGNIN